MNLDEWRVVFLVATVGLALVAVYPALTLVNLPSGSEEFSEFWLLGPNHAAEGYPFNVTAGEVYTVFVGLGNQMGSSEYYMVYVKFGNATQLNFSCSEPSPLLPLAEFRAFVSDEDGWESAVTFGFQSVHVDDVVQSVDNVTVNVPILTVEYITLDEMTFPVNASTSWDSERNGFIFRLSFELWHYDTTLKSLSFHDRIVGLQLNMTGY